MKNLLIILLLLIGTTASAQQDSAGPDTTPAPVVIPPLTPPPAVSAPRRLTRADSLRRDSLATLNDSLARIRDSIAADTLKASLPADSIQVQLRHRINSDSARFENPFFLKFTRPVRYTVTQKMWVGKEEIFYSVIALLIIFASLRNAFGRYVGDLFKVYFRTTARQKQIREQMLQAPLPSLLFNIFFTLSAGVYTALLFYHYHWADQMNLLLLALYCAIALAAIYAGKFFTLRLLGWIMGAEEVAGTYIFIVFSTNKIIGILLLPFIVLLAFTGGGFYLAAVSLSIFVVVSLFIYRYFLSYITVNRLLRLHFLHFLVYLAAFEVLPLLVINKLLVMLLAQLY